MKKKLMQDMFNQVATHLLTQNKRSSSRHSGSCLYRGPGGLKCAIGALIPDEMYRRGLEAKSFDRLIEYAPEMILFLGVEGDYDRRFFSSLQDVHDTYDPPEWPRRLLSVADNFGLSGRVVIQQLARRAKEGADAV